METLLSLPGAVNHAEMADPFLEGLRHPSPSFNFILGNTHLIPFGSTTILWGPSKGGKSIIANGLIGQLHKDYPDAVVLKYDTEGREKLQVTPLQKKIWGIDDERYFAYSTNNHKEIFNVIAEQVPKMIEAGINIKAIVIDSISDIMGRRASDPKNNGNQQMGDEAATIKDGLKLIKFVIKRNDIALILIAQERAELDTTEQMRGKKTHMAGASYLKHMAEYFIHVSPNESAKGKVDLLGNRFETQLKDLNDKKEQIAHKIRVKMQNSTIGPKNRTGEFTLHYYKGVINTQEEIYWLSVNRGIVMHPSASKYILPDFPEKGKEISWVGKAEYTKSIADNPALAEEIIRRLREQDIVMMREGKFFEGEASTDDKDVLDEAFEESNEDTE